MIEVVDQRSFDLLVDNYGKRNFSSEQAEHFEGCKHKAQKLAAQKFDENTIRFWRYALGIWKRMVKYEEQTQTQTRKQSPEEWTLSPVHNAYWRAKNGCSRI